MKKEGVPAWFRDYANQLREAESVKSWLGGGGGAGGGGSWWRNLDKSLRCYILSGCVPDDWEKYLNAPWQSMPVELRSNIAVQARAIERMVRGCPWR